MIIIIQRGRICLHRRGKLSVAPNSNHSPVLDRSPTGPWGLPRSTFPSSWKRATSKDPGPEHNGHNTGTRVPIGAVCRGAVCRGRRGNLPLTGNGSGKSRTGNTDDGHGQPQSERAERRMPPPPTTHSTWLSVYRVCLGLLPFRVEFELVDLFDWGHGWDLMGLFVKK